MEFSIKDLNNKIEKEFGFEYRVKMDAIGLQGIWLGFPSGTIPTGRAKYAAGLYYQMLEEMYRRNKNKFKKQSPYEVRDSLLKEVEKRIQTEDEDDLVTILAL